MWHKLALVILVFLSVSVPSRAQAAWPTLSEQDLPAGVWIADTKRMSNEAICANDSECLARFEAAGRLDGVLTLFTDSANPGRVFIVQDVEVFVTAQDAADALALDCMFFQFTPQLVSLPTLGPGARLCLLPATPLPTGYFQTWISFARGRMHVTLATWGNVTSQPISQRDLLALASKLYKQIGE